MVGQIVAFFIDNNVVVYNMHKVVIIIVRIHMYKRRKNYIESHTLNCSTYIKQARTKVGRVKVIFHNNSFFQPSFDFCV